MAGPTAYLYLNSNLLKITGLQNAATAAYVNGGVTVTADIIPAAGGAAVTGSAISLAYVASSNGNWQGVFPSTVSVSLNQHYTCRLTADGGVNLKGYWEIPLKVELRRP